MPEPTRQPRTQQQGAPPIIENPRLPRMDAPPAEEQGAKPKPPKPIKPGKGPVMPKTPPAAKAARNTMPPVGKLRPKTPRDAERPPQQPRAGDTSGGGERGEGYVRLRVRVEDGQMTILSAAQVPGPLVEPQELHAGHAYEVTVDQTRVALGSVPDVGVMRSFPVPNAAADDPRVGHHLHPMSRMEFNVRIPRDALDRAALPRAEIVLYRVKEPLPARPVGPAPMAPRFERELRAVARLKGIPAEHFLSAPRAATGQTPERGGKAPQ